MSFEGNGTGRHRTIFPKHHNDEVTPPETPLAKRRSSIPPFLRSLQLWRTIATLAFAVGGAAVGAWLAVGNVQTDTEAAEMARHIDGVQTVALHERQETSTRVTRNERDVAVLTTLVQEQAKSLERIENKLDELVSRRKRR